MDTYEKQKYTGSLAFFASIFLIICIVTLIHFIIPDTLDIDYITTYLTPKIEDFTAEKAEKISYMLSVMLYPLIFFIFYKLFKKHINNFSERKLKIITISEIVLGIVSLPLFTLFSVVTKRLYAINVISPILALISIFLFSYLFIQADKKTKLLKIIYGIIFIIITFYIYQAFKVYNTPTYATSAMDLHHFEAYFYPIYKTISGMTPGVDFMNLYGFYPYIYSLFFNLNNISIQGISLFNAILVSLSLVFLAYIIFKNINNKVLAFMIYNVCLIYSIFASFNNQVSRHGVYYLQYLPHRMFFVMMIGALITLYLNINNEKIKKIIEYLGFIIASIAIFWNIESGIAALAGWSSLHFYLALNKQDRIKNIIKIFIKAFLSIFAAFFAIFIATYIHSSQLLNPVGLFFGQFIFYSKGFYMVKMHVLKQPFVLVLAVYCIALADSIKSAVENQVKKEDILKFTFAVIGFGIFTYFQGRSHVLCLIACSYPMYIILGILMENYYNKYIEYKNTSENPNLSKFISISNFIKFSLLFALSSVVTLGCLIYMAYMHKNIEYITKILPNVSTQAQNIKLLNPNDDYDFLTQDASFYYMYLKKPNLLPFSGMCDLFFQDDYIKIDEYLKKSNKKLVVDRNIYKNISVEYFKKNYNLEASNDIIYIYTKK